MSRSTGLTIADSLQLSLGYAERLLKDVSSDRFARFSSPGGQMVEANHPAFVYGHLSIYAPVMIRQLGGTGPEVPAGFEEVFSKDADCVDDPDGTVYPAMNQITETFFSGYRAVLEALKSAPDEVFQNPNPLGGGMAEKFPTIGSMHSFYVGGHMMIHMGQMSTWRRMEGLGRA